MVSQEPILFLEPPPVAEKVWLETFNTVSENGRLIQKGKRKGRCRAELARHVDNDGRVVVELHWKDQRFGRSPLSPLWPCLETING